MLTRRQIHAETDESHAKHHPDHSRDTHFLHGFDSDVVFANRRVSHPMCRDLCFMPAAAAVKVPATTFVAEKCLMELIDTTAFVILCLRNSSRKLIDESNET